MYRTMSGDEGGGTGDAVPRAARPAAPPPALAGVGIAYHPFLHGLILREREAFDFVDVALDPYLDEAQRALRDPDMARLAALARARPVAFSGSAFSLASAETFDAAPVAAAVARLLMRTGARRLREDLAFRRVAGRDLGLPQCPPATPALADVAGPRASSLAERLPCRVVAGLSAGALLAAPAAEAEAFVQRFAARTACGLVLDVADTDAAADPAPLLARLRALPPGRVEEIALRTDGPGAWRLLEALVAATGAGAVTIHRTRALYPLGDILAAAARARAALAGAPAARATGFSTAPPPEPLDTATIAAFADAQASFAESCRPTAGEAPVPVPVPEAVAAVRSHALWRERVADIHRAQQLARWALRPAMWET